MDTLERIKNCFKAKETGQGIERKSQSSKEVKDKNGGIIENLANRRREAVEGAVDFTVKGLGEMRPVRALDIYNSQNLTSDQREKLKEETAGIEVKNATHATHCAQDLHNNADMARKVADCIYNAKIMAVQAKKEKKALLGSANSFSKASKRFEGIKDQSSDDLDKAESLRRGRVPGKNMEQGHNERINKLKKIRLYHRQHVEEVKQVTVEQNNIASEKLAKQKQILKEAEILNKEAESLYKYKEAMAWKKSKELKMLLQRLKLCLMTQSKKQ